MAGLVSRCRRSCCEQDPDCLNAYRRILQNIEPGYMCGAYVLQYNKYSQVVVHFPVTAPLDHDTESVTLESSRKTWTPFQASSSSLTMNEGRLVCALSL